MFTGINSHSCALVAAIAVLTGAAIVRGGAAAADTNQDDHFLALLDEENIPAVANVPTLIATAHGDCQKLTGGMPVGQLVDEKIIEAYSVDPVERQYPVDRLARTMARFVAAAVGAYCPAEQSKLAPLMADPTPDSSQPAHPVAVYTQHPAKLVNYLPAPAVRGTKVAGVVWQQNLTEGGIPDPPQIPAPSPPVSHALAPHAPVVKPPPPKQPPPQPQQAPPQPQQPPPAAGPLPGGAGGPAGGGVTGGGGGGNGSGGDGTENGPDGGAPEPAPPMAPGFVRLAP